MKYDLELVEVTPSEAAAISGVSTTMQRDWRRRGILPSSDRHMKFNIFSIAELWVYKLMSDRGVGPQFVKELSKWLVSGIVWQALKCREAYDGDESELMVEPDDDETQKLLEQVKSMGVLLDNDSIAWHAKADGLTRSVFLASGQIDRTGRLILARFFLWFPDGSHSWQHSIDDCFDSPEKFDTNGPVLVLDQASLGRLLIEKCNRPMVIVNTTKR